jgi:hypothetical protein
VVQPKYDVLRDFEAVEMRKITAMMPALLPHGSNVCLGATARKSTSLRTRTSAVLAHAQQRVLLFSE